MKMHHFSSKRKQTLRYRWTRVNGSSLIYAKCILKVVGMFEQIFSIFDVTLCISLVIETTSRIGSSL